jgi:hypothetical protein
MFKKIMGRSCMIVVVLGTGIVGATGCATDSPQSTSTMTPEQVKSNADKSFERLKQEEKNRAVGSGPAPY